MEDKEFAKLIKENYPLIKDKARKIAEHDVEDLVQNVMLRAWLYRKTFVRNESFCSWLNAILRHSTPHHQKIYTIPIKDIYSECSDDMSLHREYYEILLNIHSSMDSNTRCLSLYIKGYKYREIAEMQNVNVGTVKSRIFKAKRIWKQKMSKEL